MSKRNIAYVKPDEPAFLKRIKQQIGYQEPEDTLDLKRGPIQNIDSDDSDQYEEKEDEKPQIVQLKSGDLTEEEAIAKEEQEKPADLSQRIIFKTKKKKDDQKDKLDESSGKKSKKDKVKEKPAKSLLSFDDEEEGD